MTNHGDQPASKEPPGRLGIFRNTLADLLDTPPHVLVGLRFSEDAARLITEEQWVLELFQNARDAVVKRGKAGARVRVVIKEDAILVANDGARFDRAGYEAVTGISRSSKGDGKPGGGAGPLQPGVRPLGRHGIGFKSVLQATDRPQIFANTPEGNRFAIEAGAPRVVALCTSLAQGDVAACLSQLSQDEQRVFQEETAAPLGLEHRSLRRHLDRRGVDLDGLVAGLPVMPLPLWVDDVPAEVAPLLGWDNENADEKPFDTVVRLPLRSTDADRVRSHLRAELIPARRAFMGVHVKIETQDDSG